MEDHSSPDELGVKSLADAKASVSKPPSIGSVVPPQGGPVGDVELGRVEQPPSKFEERKGIHPDVARYRIVQALLGIFALTLVLPFLFEGLVSFSSRGGTLSEAHWEYLKILVAAEGGLLGAAIAYYFSSK